jgi:hypothetical protein
LLFDGITGFTGFQKNPVNPAIPSKKQGGLIFDQLLGIAPSRY